MKNQKGFTLIELLIVIAIIGIIAAIAIPGLLRARVSANEASAIGDTRTVLSGAIAFAASNCGWFGSAMTSYVTPSGGTGIPGYPAAAPVFLEASMLMGVKSGYTRLYTPYTPAPAPFPATCNAVSFLSFCYGSTPASILTGVRLFTGHASGTIYVGIAACDGTGLPAGGTALAN